MEVYQMKCGTHSDKYKRPTKNARATAYIVAFFCSFIQVEQSPRQVIINYPFGAHTYKIQHINFRMFLDNENLLNFFF